MGLRCPQCNAPLKPKVFQNAEFQPCLACGEPLRIYLFPTLFQTIEKGVPGESILAVQEAGCFYHPLKKAILPCSACGRFLCALCDMDLDGRHLCPACLESGKNKGKFKSLERGRILYDTLALVLALAPMLFFWPTLVTPFMVLYVAIRFRKAPTSITGRTRWRFLLASLIACLQIACWAALILNFRHFR